MPGATLPAASLLSCDRAIMPDVKETTDQHRVIVAVPANAVPELEREGLADPLPVFRGAALDAAVTVGTDAAALVTLLQAPDAIRAFAAWMRGRWMRSGDSIDLAVTHGNRRVHLTVDGDVDIEAVAGFLTAAFAGDDVQA